MQFFEYCTESEGQNGYVGAEWFYVYQLLTLMIHRRTETHGSLPLPNISTEYHTAYC